MGQSASVHGEQAVREKAERWKREHPQGLGPAQKVKD